MENKRVPKMRFDGFCGEWKEKKLEEVFEQTSDYVNPKEENIELWSLTVDKGLTPKTDRYNREFLVKKDDKFKSVLPNEFIYNPMNMTLGAVDLNLTKKRVAVSGYYITMMTNKAYDSKYFGVWLKSPIAIKKYKSYATGSLIEKQRVQYPTLAQIKTLIPSENEQIMIGDFFNQLDDTIALHQQELAILKQTKQGFLQKMFPKEGESVPEIRFPEFTGDWEPCKLDSIVDRVKSYSLSRSVETNEYTGYKYIHYGDIHTKIAGVIDESSKLPNIEPGNYEILKKGDVVLADASEDYQGIAEPAVIMVNTPYKLVSGLHTIALRPKHVNSLFLYYLIHSRSFRKHGYKTGTGMKVFGISVKNVLKFEGKYPVLEEQIKIGNFFKQLDDTIALQEQELETLKQTKKAFLQKMFV